jgi:hypothetical protein
MKKNELSCAVLALLALSGCDPAWVRESTVKIPARSFPTCVAEAMRGMGLQPEEHVDRDGNKRLVAFYVFGPLSVTGSEREENAERTLTLQLLGRGSKPPPAIEPKLDKAMNQLEVAISERCSDG